MTSSSNQHLEGQLNEAERTQIDEALSTLLQERPICLEVGTYKGGGSTLRILRTLAKGEGQLYGIEASPEIFSEMKSGLLAREPELCQRFVPLCGFSQKVLPDLFSRQIVPRVNFVFLDGGNNPREQIEEFDMLDPHMPVGSILMAHDALLRKGKWLRRILPLLNHFETRILPLSTEGLLVAKKVRDRPTRWSATMAKCMLFLNQLAPLELAARLVPAGIRALPFRFLPRRFAAWIADGRSL